LNFGEMIGQGTPGEIRKNADVVAAYLGAAHADQDDDDAVSLAPTAPSASSSRPTR
jgi:Branched-chain amino acid ATP-binding cassette transporter